MEQGQFHRALRKELWPAICTEIALPAQSLKSVQSAPSKQQIKSELRLPTEQPSLNVNPTPGAQLKVESPSIPVRLLDDPPVNAKIVPDKDNDITT
jgi:hypothetical protein